MIDVQDLVKTYDGKRVLDGMAFHVAPGRVTAFLGPNGAGKSTTLRMITGMGTPDAGRATVLGVPYRELPAPLRAVGTLLDASAVHPALTPRAHLTWLARTHRIPRDRVAAVLDLVGLADAARRPVRGFSLGMRQRLGIAAALLGDPEVLLLDEPVNGLDPEGIRWFRTLVRALADEGRTVLVSSHLMAEMAAVADHVLVIGRGRVLADGPLEQFVKAARPSVRLSSPRLEELSGLLHAAGARVSRLTRPGGSRPTSVTEATVTGLSCARIGDLAAASGCPIHELTPERPALEDVYLRLTDEVGEHRASDPAPASGTRRNPYRV
ncbi:ATP-binding cassette domain-containing protein [Streptomyces sp. NBC_00513]|uniref:ABC transporter ATP-binding protein n=1 Tax=unclassified Streptomyces TaxID=2593676 RepID=UPI00224F9635|nr:ATP-binding cassette domain-containing protein [Streptomyces sp. NBC_00424]MCX5071200.1 ATP-binding cassette domain-containing protein [Streptomyces sp. NBC_00424]WUD45384.1 ATP-binding cassette domain-containing protein [Streptomyces sp. NBC_00513]